MPYGLSLGITDYYFPDMPLFETSVTDGSHALELNGGFSYKDLSLSANYIFNEAGGAGSIGSDMYFEVGYSFRMLKMFAGAGNGWHTEDGEFNFCNLGVGASKDIVITESFRIPLSGQIVVNPDRETLRIVAGVSF